MKMKFCEGDHDPTVLPHQSLVTSLFVTKFRKVACNVFSHSQSFELRRNLRNSLVAAAGLICIGAWVYKEYHHYDLIAESLYTLVPATILMAVGVFFFLLGIIGFIGAYKEQKCLLGLFFTILLVILVGMVSTAILGYIKRADVESAVEQGIKQGMDAYNNETVWKNQIDFMQSELKCCGLDNYTDWFQTPRKTYPNSCCVNNTCAYPKNSTSIDPMLFNNGTGCYVLVKDQFIKHLGIVTGVALAFVIVLILGMAFSCVLICKRRSQVPYIGLREPSGMRV
ncbi:hypothetical protein LSH36_63g09008 [Paralvinella palmiformis]|uniref:Tetraspanin n=1 Tax=Paralvinella palmiformis TaxID=53620 RepID=A0AAD9K506_9ANNE|nr:hypothetical protein LSH36_63g09008 [Paralvinella palmiformis]